MKVSAAGAVGLVSGIGLGVFAFRRLVLLAAPRRSRPPASTPPRPLTLVVPARDEAALLGETLEALAALEYSRSTLLTVLVDDGSSDTTGEQLEAWAETRQNALVLRLGTPVGKAQALNEAIAAAPRTELVGVCDADVRPLPDCFARLAEPFGDERVGAVIGYRRPANASVSLTSRYAAVETWVHQLVTAEAKDRLALNPPSLGLCIYRRSALDEIGGFPATGAEDADSSLALTRAGWSTVFLQEAVADSLLVTRPGAFWSQRLRWTGNLIDASRPRTHRVSPRAAVPLSRRVEAMIVSTAYLDRVFFCSAVLMVAAGALPVWVPTGYLGLRALEVLVALHRAGVRRERGAFLLAVAVYLPLDVLAAFASFVAYPWRERHGWRSPRPLPRAS